MKSFEDYLEGEREKITMDMRTFLKLHEKAVKYDILRKMALNTASFASDSTKAIYDIKDGEISDNIPD